MALEWKEGGEGEVGKQIYFEKGSLAVKSPLKPNTGMFAK